ncbi:DNA-binding transcriptional regulator [Methylobacterium bullatum]|uniref:helix-turn-helix domain-containing protein n=1 Tax=Methylobacterium bullatum TaxID=570505 RepID=UPI0017873D86|nr:helix-turn-helix transcriptional regulator [Methylobacterium bullatum]MBD8903789.1 hypothetical protein [Methylobacterium bullatum]
MMDAEQFKVWRKELGLTQKQAAAQLGVATLTVQQYERGFRHDNQQPVSIPEKIEQACRAVSLKLMKISGVIHLRFKAVPDEMLKKASDLLSEQGVSIRLKAPLAFFGEHYQPFSEEIDEWISCDMNVAGTYAKFVIPMVEAPGGKIVALHFSDDNEAFGFAIRFAGGAKSVR